MTSKSTLLLTKIALTFFVVAAFFLGVSRIRAESVQANGMEPVKFPHESGILLDDNGPDVVGVEDGVLHDYLIHAIVYQNEVEGFDWVISSYVTLTIDDPGIGGVVNYEETKIVDNYSGVGRVFFQVPSISFPLMPGQNITLTDGTITRSYTISDPMATSYEDVGDLVNGKVTPVAGGHIFVFAWNGVDWTNVEAAVKSSGRWSADFSAVLNINATSQGYVYHYDSLGNFTVVRWEADSLLSNDTLANPIVIPSIPYLSYQSTVWATGGDELNFFPCGQLYDNMSVWYLYQPLGFGNMYLDTFGSNYNTMVCVWQGPAGGQTVIAYNDNAAGTQQSKLNFYYQTGETYWIGVVQSGTGTTGGNLQLHVTTFEDVAGNHPLWRYVEGFFGAEITTGCAVNPLKYCPDRNVTRAEMAVFVLRAIHKDALPYTPTPSTTGIFADVPTPGKDWMQPWIEEFYEIGITTGCAAGPLRYCPERNVTRGEMAVFLLRAMHKDELPYIPNPEPDTVGIFADVPASNWMKPWIEEFYDEEITTGCGTSGDKLLYCPNRNVTRAEMATFIDRAFDIAQIP